MVEISLSGSGEGLGGAISRGYEVELDETHRLAAERHVKGLA